MFEISRRWSEVANAFVIHYLPSFHLLLFLTRLPFPAFLVGWPLLALLRGGGVRVEASAHEEPLPRQGEGHGAAQGPRKRLEWEHACMHAAIKPE